MSEQIISVLGTVEQVLKIIGAAALVLGFVVATLRYAREIRALGARSAFGRYRQSIGRVVLIGLEILVAATIIKTVTIQPTLEELGLLAVMIAIRTILGWAMFVEVNRRWPWQKAPSAESPATAAGTS
jgi:uncharacterized membrane protein